jgi:hypothetical protein
MFSVRVWARYSALMAAMSAFSTAMSARRPPLFVGLMPPIGDGAQFALLRAARLR